MSGKLVTMGSSVMSTSHAQAGARGRVGDGVAIRRVGESIKPSGGL